MPHCISILCCLSLSLPFLQSPVASSTRVVNTDAGCVGMMGNVNWRKRASLRVATEAISLRNSPFAVPSRGSAQSSIQPQEQRLERQTGAELLPFEMWFGMCEVRSKSFVDSSLKSIQGFFFAFASHFIHIYKTVSVKSVCSWTILQYLARDTGFLASATECASSNWTLVPYLFFFCYYEYAVYRK